jgi:hypothetical protein
VADPVQRRNNLAQTLANLRSSPSVSKLYREARRGGRATSMSAMLARTPEGLESPRYRVAAERGSYEVREYEGYACVSTEERGPRAFGTLAGYIFGRNEEARALAMTTPVLMRAPSSPGPAMSFVLPSSLWNSTALPADAPTPLGGADVTPALVPPRTVAALWFGGLAGPAEVKARKRQLAGLLEGEGGLEVAGGEGMVVASYNDPFTR